MQERALYFPYIRVPKSDWFTRILLYWDEVAAIVPSDYYEQPECLGQHMQGLIRDGMVRTLPPGNYTYRFPDFSSSFLDLVQGRAPGRPERREWVIRRWPRIHMEKLGQLGEELSQRGLAVRADTRRLGEWFNVEPNTAKQFMLYLAGLLGQCDGGYDPITDSTVSLSAYLPGERGREAIKARSVILNGVLPAPSGDVRPRDLLRFKAKNRDHLRAFRRCVENAVSELGAIAEAELRDERAAFLLKDLRAQAREVSESLKATNRWQRISAGTLCSLTTSMLLLPDALEGNRRVVVAGALTVAAAIATTLGDARPSLEGKPMAYAALASRLA